MASNRGRWLDRQGQAGAATAINQVLNLQQQPGEQVQHIFDELVEDSPYQARRPFTRESIEELAQGMREVGFQGVLIVRPHSETAKRRSGAFQLVYGHRRRAAWRQVCVERGEICQLPVVVREVSDERMLTIGAQENLQRQDLDPIEEAQLVAWHERVFFEKNQAEIGALLGKSSDWVSVRSRVHRLPDELKERLRQRPRALSQMLELGSLYVLEPDEAVALADRVVLENLSLDTIRSLVRGYTRPERRNAEEEKYGRGVQRIASEPLARAAQTNIPNTGAPQREMPDQAADTDGRRAAEPASRASEASVHSPALVQNMKSVSAAGAGERQISDLLLLQEAASALASIAKRARSLPTNEFTERALDQVEEALMLIRRVLADS